MAKHSEATIAKLRELYLKRKAIKAGRKVANTSAKPLTTLEQKAEREKHWVTLDKILASPR